VLSSCSKDSIDYSTQLDQKLYENISRYAPDGNPQFYILPGDNQMDLIPQDDNNPLFQGKIELGKMLFYETGLGNSAAHTEGMKTYSCASCHIPEAAFGPGRIQGIGDGGEDFGIKGEERRVHQDYMPSDIDIQGIRPLNLVNVAYVVNTFWNGQFGGSGANINTQDLWNDADGTIGNHMDHQAIEIQNFEGLEVHRMHIDKEIALHYGYKELFDNCFPELEEEQRYTNHAAALAISAYIRTIISNQAPFQDYLKGNSNAMSPAEKEGAILFFGKAKCAGCHYEKNLGSTEFHVLGVKDMDQNPNAINPDPDDPRNLGRGGFTLQEYDKHKFKVPGLYNISESAFYFHGASKSSLEDVIRYKMKALRENPRVRQIEMSPKLYKLELSDTEVENLEAFLAKSLKDPDLSRYKAESINSGLCYPNNDFLSRLDLGCQ